MPGTRQEYHRLAEWDSGISRAEQLQGGQLFQAINDENPGTRWKTLERLVEEEAEDDRTHRALATALHDRHSDVRSQALVQLVNLANKLAASSRAEVLRTIDTAIADETQDIQDWVRQELGESDS